MGRGNLEPRFAPMPIATPAPTPVAPPPAPLPSVEPAPMPAPVAPLPNISGLPDLSNIDLSGLPGLPQMPLPAPVAAPAPAPTPAPVPAPLPAADPYMGMTQADLREIGVTLPPMTVEPAPAPVPVTPPPLPPQPVPPPPAPVVEPVPAPVPVTPPPTPPTPVAPPLEPRVAPAPLPEPVVPPATPPVPAAPMPDFSNIDLSNFNLPDLSNLDLSNIPGMPQPSAPPAPVAPAPTPMPPPPTPAPAPTPPRDLPVGRYLEPEPGMVPPVQPVVAPPPVMSEPPPQPGVPAGIEGLAGNFELTEDFALPVNRRGVTSNTTTVSPRVLSRVDEVGGEPTSIPMPDGSSFDVGNIDLSNLDLGNIDFSNIDLSGVDLAGFGATPDTQTTQQTQSPDNSGLYPGMNATQVSEIEDYFRNNPNISSLGQYRNPYFTGDGFTDGQQDAAGVIPGAGAAANATTNASTNPNAGQDWYENMTDEQREAYDAFIAGGGLANLPGGTIDLSAIGGGTVNIPGYGGYTGTTPRPVVEAIQNLTVNRDPTLAGNVSAATQYGLTGAPPVQAPSTNPFQRPETQQGIGSLAGGG